MSPKEIGDKILLWWRLDYDLEFIAFWVTMLYAPLTVRDILVVVRHYIDAKTEDKHPEPGEITWR